MIKIAATLVLALGSIFAIATYIYFALALMTIAKKTNTTPAWIAWIPIAQFYLMSKIAKMHWWTFVVFLVSSFIPFVGTLAMMVILIWWWWKIAEARGKYGWISLLLLIPVVNLIILGIIAWSDD